MQPSKLIALLKNDMDHFAQEEHIELIKMISDFHNETGEYVLVPLENNGLRIISANDIYFIKQPKKGKIFIHTYEEIIEYTTMKTNLLDYMVVKNKKFRLLNSGLVVNIDKMVGYNSYYRKVYLSDDLVIDVTGAAINNIVRKILGKDKDRCKDTQINNYAF